MAIVINIPKVEFFSSNLCFTALKIVLKIGTYVKADSRVVHAGVKVNIYASSGANDRALAFLQMTGDTREGDDSYKSISNLFPTPNTCIDALRFLTSSFALLTMVSISLSVRWLWIWKSPIFFAPAAIPRSITSG